MTNMTFENAEKDIKSAAKTAIGNAGLNTILMIVTGFAVVAGVSQIPERVPGLFHPYARWFCELCAVLICLIAWRYRPEEEPLAEKVSFPHRSHIRLALTVVCVFLFCADLTLTYTRVPVRLVNWEMRCNSQPFYVPKPVGESMRQAKVEHALLSDEFTRTDVLDLLFSRADKSAPSKGILPPSISYRFGLLKNSYVEDTFVSDCWLTVHSVTEMDLVGATNKGFGGVDLPVKFYFDLGKDELGKSVQPNQVVRPIAVAVPNQETQLYTMYSWQDFGRIKLSDADSLAFIEVVVLASVPAIYEFSVEMKLSRPGALDETINVSNGKRVLACFRRGEIDLRHGVDYVDVDHSQKTFFHPLNALPDGWGPGEWVAEERIYTKPVWRARKVEEDTSALDHPLMSKTMESEFPAAPGGGKLPQHRHHQRRRRQQHHRPRSIRIDDF